MNNLLKNVEFVAVENAASAGTSALTTEVIDMAGWTGVVFVAKLGDVTNGSELALTAYHDDESDGSFDDLEGAVSHDADATDADNKMMILDVVRPLKRYVRAVLTRATQNAVVDSIIAIKYGPLHTPVTQGATVLESATLPNPDPA